MAAAGEITLTHVVPLFARLAAPALKNRLVFTRLLTRNWDETANSPGASITIRYRKPLTPRAGGTAYTHTGTTLDLTQVITIDRLQAWPVVLLLDKVAYVSYAVEDKIQATSFVDVMKDYVDPATIEMSQQIDTDAITEFLTGTDYQGTAIPVLTTAASTFSDADVRKGMKTLNDAKAPMENRRMVMGSQHQSEALGADLFVQAQQAGSTDALRNAELGRLFGFDSYMSQNVPQYSTTKGRTLFFNENVEAFASRPFGDPGVPGQASAIQNLPDVGLSCRVQSFYAGFQRTAIIAFDCLYGFKVIDSALGAIMRTV